MKRFTAWICALAMTLGCMGDLTLVASAAQTGADAPRAAGGLTYYVSTSGSGGNDGRSESSPLPGLSAVPWDQLLPGDSVLLKKGDVFPGFIRLVDVHGESGNPITIGTYGTGSAPCMEAMGQGIWLQETGSTASVANYASAGVLLYDCSYVTVSGLDISNRPVEMKSSFQDAAGYSDRDGKSDHTNEKLDYSGVAVAADGVGTAEGIVLEDITVHGDSDVQAVIKETTSSVTETNVVKGAEAPVRTLTEATGTYYVSSLHGSDSNDGSSPDKAFYSLHKINAMDLGPGAKVYLERGSVFENQYLHPNGGGADGAPIVIDAYGLESEPRPVINTNGNGVWYQNYRKNLDNSGHVRHGYVSSCINLYDIEYIEIRNLAMTNFGRYDETPGADFANLGSYDGGTVPGETGYSTNGNTVGTYTWGGKMSRTGVSGVSQNVGTMDHVYLQNLDIENIYGNIMHKHMNNGGIYFTMAAALDESETGVPKFDDLRIEGCYLYRTSRWGIAAAYTGAHWEQFTGAAISDETAEKYGATHLYIGHNYIEEVGGDPITTMYAFEPVIEYNVALNGGREMSSVAGVSNYMNGTHVYGNRGDVSAGIWPWKCKTALFEHNECYSMLYGRINGGIGNNDAQAWDADYGDSTIYQYNYSSGNTGGCVMFCYTEAYNTVFRYNISYKDGMPGNDRGVLDMSANPNGQVTNNTFVMAENTLVHRGGHAGRAQVENNIFYNLGAAYNPSWNANNQLTYNNNIYAGFSGGASTDSSAITLGKDAALFAGDVTSAPEAPKSTSKAGVGVVNGIRSWAHDWSTDFEMFKLAQGGSNAAVNAGLPHNYTGLTQDSSFGVPNVPNDKDFFGNALDDVHDVGAHDTRTTGGTLPSNSANELVSSLYEVRNTTEIHVPFTANNPLSVDDFVSGLTVSKGAVVNVYNGTQKVSGNIAANMTVKIVAEDGTENPTVYTIKNKNSYNHKTDFVASQQGNAWFHQVRQASNNELINLTSFDGGAQGWWTGPNNACAEYNGAADDDRNVNADGVASEQKFNGSGFVFRAPVTGTVTISFPEQPKFRYPARAYNNSYDTYVIVYVNGQEVEGTRTQVPRPTSSTAAAVAAEIASKELTVAQGDTIEFMVVNLGEFTSPHQPNGCDVLFNVAVNYEDKAVTELPDDTKAPSTPSGLRAWDVTQTEATIRWSASTDNRGVAGYKVQLNDGAAQTVTEPEKTFTGLTANTEYTVTVWAVDAAGNESSKASITFRTAKAVVMDTTAPTAPTRGETVSVTPSTATIRWTAATDNVGVAGYEITVNGKKDILWNSTSCTLKGLNPATQYTVSVVAFDAAGNRSATALTITFTTAQRDTAAPSVPTGLAVVAMSRGKATLRWEASTDNVGVAGYTIRVNDEETDVGNVLQYTLTDLGLYTEYTVQVRAYDAAGNQSAWTQEVTFTTSGSSENRLLSSVFEVRDSNLEVPYTEHAPMSLTNLIAGLEVSEQASVRVYNGDAEVTSGNVSAGMTVKIVAQDGTENPTVYTIHQKNTYNHSTDWVNNQQGNVWFSQYEEDGSYHDYTTWTASGNGGWWGGQDSSGFISAEQVGACDDVRAASQKVHNGSGFTFRAPATGMVEISFPTQPVFRNPGCSSNSYTTSLVIYRNGVQISGKKFELPKTTTPSVEIEPFTVAITRGDTIEFMVLNEGATATGGQGGVAYNPQVAYLDVELPQTVESITLNHSTATLYTNADDANHTITLTATVRPDNAVNKDLVWTTSSQAVATVDNGVVSAQGTGTATITATAADGSGVSASCVVTVKTKLANDITISGTAKFGSVLTANVGQIPDAAKGKLTYQWKRGGSNITGATAQTYTLVEADIGQMISVTVTATDPYEGTRTASLSAAVDKADGIPVEVNPTPVDCTTPENNDGKLTGLHADRLYDYQAIDDETWTPVAAGSTEITGLTPGSYHIRRAETSTHYAGAPSETVTILGYNETAYDVNIAQLTGGVVRADVRRAAEGATVTLTITPDADYEYVEGSLKVYKTGDPNTAVVVTNNQFTMPGYSVTVEAQFAKQTVNPPVTPPAPSKPSKPEEPPAGTEIKENPDGSVTTIVTDPETGAVTETTMAPDGGKVEKATDADKNVSITVTDPKGEVLADVSLPAAIPEPGNRFTDVPANHWADKAIHELAGLELVTGVSKDTFNMNGVMTRGALATILCRMANGQEGLAHSFTDVAESTWYTDGVAWAARTGVVTGYSADRFGPNDTITREQMAVMLYRFAGLLGMDTATDTGALGMFDDGVFAHDWAAEGMSWCIERGILQGKGNMTLAPNATATRAEVAVMLSRLMEQMR